MVKFSVKTRNDETSFWSGIGFNKVPSMEGADIILGYKEAHSTVGSVVDLFASPGRKLVRDIGQSFTKGEYKETSENNHTFIEIKFQRPLDTGDNLQDMRIDQCVRFLYPVWPGLVVGGEPQQHQKSPIISQEQMCMQMCENLAGAKRVDLFVVLFIMLILSVKLIIM